VAKLIAFILASISIVFLLVNAVIIIKEGTYIPIESFILGITGLVMAAFFHKKE
jgi:hypothetical protein